MGSRRPDRLRRAAAVFFTLMVIIWGQTKGQRDDYPSPRRPRAWQMDEGYFYLNLVAPWQSGGRTRLKSQIFSRMTDRTS